MMRITHYSPAPFEESSVQDLHRRYAETFILFQGRPVFVHEIVAQDNTCAPMISFTTIPEYERAMDLMRWEDVDLARPATGFFVRHDEVFFGWSIPNKQWKRGLHSGNYLINTLKVSPIGADFSRRAGIVLADEAPRALSKTRGDLLYDLDVRGYSIVRHLWAAIGTPNEFIIYYGMNKVYRGGDKNGMMMPKSITEKIVQRLFSL